MEIIRNTYRDTARNITFHVLAYRPLRQPELIGAIRMYLSNTKTKKLKKNMVYTIQTFIGLRD